ncbi:MAG: non-ribosomal peptide synthetase [Verrucomicrobia bacterium]|nr:non-ribosomal peptide synthetase [Verrucomicrobiota bacterium]
MTDSEQLSESSRRNALVEWNSTQHPFPHHRCVHELFEEQVARTPDAIAVRCDGQALTYGQLNDRANQLAHWLRRQGVRPGSLIGISLERSLELVIGVYGILKAGGAYVPMDPSYPEERLAFMLQSSKAQPVLTQRDLADRWRTAGVRVLCLDDEWKEVSVESTQNPAPVAQPNDLIYVIFTSGSTGRPKGAGVFHRGFMNLVNWFMTEFSFDAADRVLVVSSPSFDLTQKNFYAPLLCGAELHLLAGNVFDPARIRQLIQTHGITRINCTPSAFYPVIEQGGPTALGSVGSLRTVCLGGEPISISRLRGWLEHASCRAEVANTYGPTECSDICAFYRLNRANLDAHDFVPTGRPIHNVQVLLVDEALQPCAPGVPGELCVAGEGVGAGYVNDPELTAAKFVPNPFPEIPSRLLYRTGDLARYLDDGLIEFLGRMDHQVKLRGFRIELPEIERALEQHPSVREAAVIVRGRAGDAADQRLVAYVVPRQAQALPAPDLRDFLKARLPDYMMPAQFVAMDRLPLSPNGKVDRRALPEEPIRVAETTHVNGSPGASLEQTILAIWRQVLGLSQVGVNDNFFEVGGNSLNLTAVHERLQSALGRLFPITDLFANPTISALVRHLEPPPVAPRVAARSTQDRARLQQAAFTRARRAVPVA